MKTLELKALGLEELTTTESKKTKGGFLWLIPVGVAMMVGGALMVGSKE